MGFIKEERRTVREVQALKVIGSDNQKSWCRCEEIWPIKYDANRWLRTVGGEMVKDKISVYVESPKNLRVLIIISGPAIIEEDIRLEMQEWSSSACPRKASNEYSPFKDIRKYTCQGYLPNTLKASTGLAAGHLGRYLPAIFTSKLGLFRQV